MSVFKKYFEKKKLEFKFKKAGEGKKLTDEPLTPESANVVKPDFVGSTRLTQEKQKAAEAAIHRLNIRQEPRKLEPCTSSAEQHNMQQLLVQSSSNSIDKLKIKFCCPLFENVSLPKHEMEIKMNEYLYSQLSSEPEMVSLLIIHTLNKNSEQIKQCIEMLDKYLGNIISHPDDDKYRRIKISNKILQEKVLLLQGAEAFLQSIGFVRKAVEMEEYLMCEEMDVARLEYAKELLQVAEPILLQLDRDCRIYQPSEQASQMPQLSDDFFSVSAEEVKKEQEIRRRAVEEAGMLMTREMREKDRKRDMRRLRYALLRFRLPDQFLIQATFTARETLDTVRNYVSTCLSDDAAEFHFFSQVCGRISESDESKSLAELGLAPAALLEVVDDQKGGLGVNRQFLKKSLVQVAIRL